MRILKAALCGLALIATLASARADVTCETVRTDLTGQNIFGRHTIKELSQDAEAGNCRAAAALSRRSRDAAGFLLTHCPGNTDLEAVASAQLAIGQRILATPGCQQ